MAIDVYLQRGKEAPRPGGDGDWICSLDDGDFAFLAPLFEELRQATGQSIDPYGDAFFTDNTLDALGQIVNRARQIVEQQPKQWEVTTGWSTHPTRQESRSKIDKSQMQELLAKLENAIARAKTTGTYIVFWGD